MFRVMDVLPKFTIFLTDPEWVKQVEDKKIPIGAMFRVMDVLPKFTLHTVGSSPTAFWRVYTLSTQCMTCEITETFSADVLSSVPLLIDSMAKQGSTDYDF